MMTDENVLGPMLSPTDKVHKSTTAVPNALTPLPANARSCVTCRKRKVKCDKKHPCNHCTRQEIECVYPPPGRAPRKVRKLQDIALVERLRRLEAVVQTLSAGSVEDENSSLSPKDSQNKDQENKEGENVQQKLIALKKEYRDLMDKKKDHKKKNSDGNIENLDGLTERFGTLLVKEGRSRYINPGFWSMFNAEVQDLKGEVEGWSDSGEDDDYLSPISHSTQSTPGFIFSLSSANVQMSLLHPPPDRALLYWQTYCENVDPMLKMLHRHTREPHILKCINQIGDLSNDAECTMFAIYYAAVTSTWSEDCRQKFGESKSDLLARYRFGMEQALARADFLQTDSIFVLQSFIIFLTCLRRQADTRSVWCLSALLVRISQGLGLHRDGSHYPSLPIYKQEMRRLVWWHTIVLDAKMCEDLGSDAGIHGRMYDTKLPRNLNDIDITFEMTQLPESRRGCTDVTFNLVRFEIGQGFAKVLKGMHKHIYLQYSVGVPPEVLQEALEKRKSIIVDLEKRLDDLYLKDADVSVPINWMTVTMARVTLGKMWLMLYQPFQRRDGGRSLSQDIRDQLFSKALECVELSLLFHTEARTPRFTKFAWLLQIYTPWQAIAFLLSELCTRTSGPEVERAWKAVDFSMDMPWTETMIRKERPDAHLWRPLRLLRKRARAAKQDATSTESSSNFAFQQSSNVTAMHGYDENGVLPTSAFGGADAGFQPDQSLPSETGPSYSPTGLKGASFSQHSNPTSNALTDTNAQLISTDPLIFVPPPQQPNDVSYTWTDPIADPMTNTFDGTMSAEDPNMTWETWDDLVAQWGIQNEDLVSGNGLDTTF